MTLGVLGKYVTLQEVLKQKVMEDLGIDLILNVKVVLLLYKIHLGFHSRLISISSGLIVLGDYDNLTLSKV